MKLLGLTTLLTTSWTLVTARSPCHPLDFGHGSVVCVCTAEYCDTLEALKSIPKNKVYHLESSLKGKRFELNYEDIRGSSSPSDADIIINVNKSAVYQKIIGFGGAITDAAALNIASVSEGLQRQILKAYFGKSGLEYNIIRTNIASCDFSSRLYSYDDVEGDQDLKHFALVDEDTKYKIPQIKVAKELNPNVKVIASPWTAPKWMKSNNNYYGTGILKFEYYGTWAKYLIKFLDEYEKQGVEIWAITAQNEPIDGLIPNFNFNCMGWTPEQQRDWIKRDLGPALTNSKHNSTKIIIFDDQRPLVLPWVKVVLHDLEAAKYVSGIGLHWYLNNLPARFLDKVHEQFPDVFMLSTEACIGSNPLEEAVILGLWNRAELYAYDIIQNLNNYVSGWTDWNIVLNLEGGPNWAKNFVDAPIIVDNVTDRAYKQPMFYALGHFSKFIVENSVRLGYTSTDPDGLNVLAVKRPDQIMVVVLLNEKDISRRVLLQSDGADVIEIVVGPHSLHTIAY